MRQRSSVVLQLITVKITNTAKFGRPDWTSGVGETENQEWAPRTYESEHPHKEAETASRQQDFLLGGPSLTRPCPEPDDEHRGVEDRYAGHADAVHSHLLM